MKLRVVLTASAALSGAAFFLAATTTNTSGSVNATGTGNIAPAPTAGPASADTCNTQYVNDPLSAAFFHAADAAGSTTFHVRLVATGNHALGTNPAAATAVTHLPEIYVNIQ